MRIAVFASLRVLWVDAVCINQNDEDEKSEQVPKIGGIYGGATKVYAWLGEADREIDCVFTVLQEFRDRAGEEKCPAHFDAAEQLSFHRQLFCDIYEAEAGSLPEQSDLDDDMLHEEFNWLRPLYLRPYWLRVWIVQELVLAKVVVVCCGDKSIDFDDIYGLSLDWGSFEQGFDTTNYQRLKPHSRGWNTIMTIRGHRRRREKVEWEMGGEVMSFKMSERGDVAMLDEVIQIYTQHHECSLPKDKVYGFRELIPQWKENLVVDYKRSDLEVFLDVAKLDLFEPKKHGGWHVAFHLWSAMGLGDREKFDDCLRQSLIDTLLANSKALSTFLLYQCSPKERRFIRWMDILRGKHPASLLDENIVIADIGELGECIQATDQQQRERLQHMCRKLKQCKQLLNRVTYLHGQRTSIQKIPDVSAVTVPTLSAPLGLSPEQVNLQRDLREQPAAIQKKLAELEEGITVLRAKVADKISPNGVTIGTSFTGQSMKKPTMSAVISTITKMTKIAESKGSDIAVLEARMRKLGLDVSAARSREAVKQSTDGSANLRPRVRGLQVTREACERWKDKARRRKEKLELVRKAFEAKKPSME